MKGKKWSVILIFSVCMTLALTGLITCSGKSEKGQVVKLKYGTYAPYGVIDDPILWFIEEASKKSGIKIELEKYYAGTLAKPEDCLDAISNNVYQLGWISTVFTPGRTPLAMIVNGTPLIVPNLYSGLKAADEIIQKFPAAANEYEKASIKYLFHTGVWHYQLISVKPVRSLKDIKGLRIRTFGYLSKAWAELGGVPVSIPIPEIYDALQKGTLDGVLTQPISMHKGLRLSEIAKYYTEVNFGCLPVPVVMNMNVWNQLPEILKQKMTDLAKDMPAKADEIIVNSELKILEEMRKEGVKIHKLSKSDEERIKKEANAITKEVIDNLTSRGAAEAKNVMNTYLKTIAINKKIEK
ncbi:MAG: TRAP transporter substrate-binding protein DctP [Deltaproteobacteria bacterium]|nr:TRAP transporter substrate-binding protein DctP [Deltaproteobacteria bacterium]